MKILLTFLFFWATLAITQAQVPGGIQSPPPTKEQPALLPSPSNDPAPKGKSKIVGYVVDSSLTKAVEFANVALYSKVTNKPVDGTVADEKGKFSLNHVAPGSYQLLISFLGFNDKVIDNLLVTKGQNLDVGVVRLSTSTTTLQEVTVTGQKALFEEKVDRLVYNADQDIAAKGGDATDILKKVPMLSVDLDGNVSLQGNSNIRVLINNKPSSIMAGSIADALKQIPADQIKSVEVITSPSARYDAEGAGGIINIITKKNTMQGLNLAMDGGLGNRASTLGLNGGYRRGKLGFNLSGNGRAIYNKASTDLEQSTLRNDTTYRTSQQVAAFDHGIFGQYALGVDYDLARNQSLTANARFGIRNFNRDQDQNTNLFADETPGFSSKRKVYSHDLSNSLDLNLDYLHTFKPQQEWSMSTQYSQNNLTNNFDANLQNAMGELTGRLKNINLNTNQEFTLQTDYQTPVAKNQSLEMGGKGIIRQVNSHYQYQLASPTSEYFPDPTHPAGALDYAQTITAAYLSYTLTTANNYTIKAGARYEHTDIRATVQEKGALAIPAYSNLVPSLNLSRKVGKNTTIKLAYNRRIQRPGLGQLNPNFNAANPQSITIGNPNLKPEITDRIEVGYSTYIKKTNLNVTLFSRLNTDDIQQMSQRSDTVPGAVVTSFQNIGKEYNYGSNLFATVNITSKWSINGNIDLMYRYIEGKAPDLSGQSVTISNTGFSVGGRLDTQAQLGKG